MKKAEGRYSVLTSLWRALTDFFHSMVGVRKPPPPILQGDINFILSEHPEFVYTRMPDEDGIPCVATASSLGEIYVCAIPDEKMAEIDVTRMFRPKLFICNELDVDGFKGKHCSEPCVGPAGWEYKSTVMPVRLREEAGEVRRVGLEVEGVATEYGAGALSQIFELKQLLGVGNVREYDQKFAVNVLGSVVANLRRLLEKSGACKGNREAVEKKLRQVWEGLVNQIGERELYSLGITEDYFSCNVLEKGGWVETPQGIPAYCGSGFDWEEASVFKFSWKPEYDTVEYYEGLLARTQDIQQISQNMEKYLWEVSPHDIDDWLYKACHETEAEMYCYEWEEFSNRMDSVVELTAGKAVELVPLEKLVKMGFITEENVSRYRDLRKEVERCERNVSECDMDKYMHLRKELLILEKDIDNAYYYYVDTYVISELMAEEVGELEKICSEKGREDLRGFASCLIVEEVEKFCRHEDFRHACVLAIRERLSELESEGSSGRATGR